MPTRTKKARKRDKRRTFNLYVVKLKRTVLQSRRFLQQNPTYPGEKDCLYVGKTWLAPDARLKQHLEAARSSALVKKYGKRLLPSKCKKIRATENVALRLERELAAELREKGYAVWQN